MTCGPSDRLGCPLALSRGLAVGDGVAADGPGTLPPDGSSAWRALVHAASPAPVPAAPTSRKNSRRSIGTRRTIPGAGLGEQLPDRRDQGDAGE
jgi:hypothetical protein